MESQKLSAQVEWKQGSISTTKEILH